MHLTARGWWFLFLIVMLVTLGLVGAPLLHLIGLDRLTSPYPYREYSYHSGEYSTIPILVLLGLTLFFWFVWEWLLFTVRSRLILPRLVTGRVIGDERGRADNLWAGRVFRVRVQVALDSSLGLPYVAVTDRLPFGVTLVSGTVFQEGALTEGTALAIDYRFRCEHVGRVRFEGVRVQIADFQGFFTRTRFLRDPVEHRVLPVLTDDMGQPATQKRHNLLPPPGIHRLHRPGSGSELLDLRDYLPGDPPKTIAWKVSARRDKLITKEFESEVPVRCTLFVDTSNSVRLGPPGANALARLVHIAASITQANASVRDLTGLCLFDEQRVTIVRAARTTRHVAELVNRLTDVAGLAPTLGQETAEPLMRVAYAFAREVYPDLMEDAVNRVPIWQLAWGWPPAAHQGRDPTWGRRLVYGFFWLLFSAIFLALGLAGYALVEWFYNRFLPSKLGEDLAEFVSPPANYVGSMYLLSLLFLYRPFVSFFCDGLPALFGTRRRRLARWRKRLSAVLALRYNLAPGGVGLLMEDNEQFSRLAQRFLAEHQVPYQLPLYDQLGRYQFAAPAKIDVLTRALLQAIGKGHDNELFVLLVDLLELADQLGPLLGAVRLALSRHHQVVLIAPWPAGVRRPSDKAQDEAQELAALLASRQLPRSGAAWHMQPVLQQLLTARLHREYHRVRQAFARLGVGVVLAESREAIPLILERLERLRGVRKRR